MGSPTVFRLEFSMLVTMFRFRLTVRPLTTTENTSRIVSAVAVDRKLARVGIYISVVNELVIAKLRVPVVTGIYSNGTRK